MSPHHYGESVFGCLQFMPQAYLHAEFANAKYGTRTATLESERVWVPFLYLGAGYYKNIPLSTAFFVEVLFDVIRDSNSPTNPGSRWSASALWQGSD